MSINTNQLENEIRAIIAKIIEVDEDKIKLDTPLTEELGADSMQALEIMVALDKKYKVSINEVDLPKMTTLQNIINIISELSK